MKARSAKKPQLKNAENRKLLVNVVEAAGWCKRILAMLRRRPNMTGLLFAVH